MSFSYTGSLLADSPFYVGRQNKLDHLVRCVTSQRPKYALIFGAPRMGKTSLVRRLRDSLPTHAQLHLIDVGEHGEDFYHYIAEKLIQRCNMQHQLQATDVRNGSDFQRLLRDLNPSMPTAVVFEHLMHVPDVILHGFSDILRNTFEEREEVGNEAFRYFCFLLTGGIELLKAVHDGIASPLIEVVEKIYLDDLSRQESDALLSYGFKQARFSDKQTSYLCECIYEQVHGHPYLTQRVAYEMVQHFLAGHALRAALVTDVVTRLLNDDQRMDAMFNKVQKESLSDTLREIVFKTQQHPWHGNWKTIQLEAIGFIREEEGQYVIRNLAYARKIAEMLALPSSGNHDTAQAPVFTYPPKLRAVPKPVLCKLQLTQQQDTFQVRVADSLTGSSSAETLILPYTPAQLRAVFKALLPVLERQYGFTAEQREMLHHLGLWNAQAGRLVQNPLKVVGRKLYDALMVGEVGAVFERLLTDAAEQNVVVALQLSFDPNEIELARYPWELLYHRKYDSLVQSRRMEVLRHMTYATDHRKFPPLVPPLRVLYIRSRPRNIDFLSSAEQERVQQTLEGLKEQLPLELTLLNPPTFTALSEYLLQNEAHLLHFDGHGKFGRRCPRCSAVNLAHLKSCQNRGCDQDLSDVSPSGYLAFEKENGDEDAIDNEHLGYAVARSDIRLAVLSACYSGTIDGETLFNGIAQSLIKQGVMAVVSTQLPISLEGAANFVHSIYRSMLETKDLVTAVAVGRNSLLNNGYNEWFVPTFYTRATLEELNKIIR